MKNLSVFLFLLFISCTQKQGTNTDCAHFKSPENLRENLPWLKELIKKAETDTTLMQSNYWGCIWLESYKGKDFFITNMMLGSGGVLLWVFDCHGNHLAYPGIDQCTACKFAGNNHFYLEEADYFPLLNELKYDFVVYSNPPDCPCDK